MDLFKAMGISSSGLEAQRAVIGVVSTNLANVQTTRTPEGGPYRRKHAVLSSPDRPPFAGMLSKRLALVGHLERTHPSHFPEVDIGTGENGRPVGGVQTETEEDRSGFRTVYDPSHPDADEHGNVALPNVNTVEEMVTLLAAVRSFEANVTAFNAAKNMAIKSLELGK